MLQFLWFATFSSIVNKEIERFLRNENDFDFVAIAGVSCCFVRRNLTRIQNYFESTVSNYFGDEFAAHFRMTRTTAELLTREVINTGRIPLGNPFGRPSIPPETSIGLPMGTGDPREHARNRQSIWHYVQQCFSDCCSSYWSLLWPWEPVYKMAKWWVKYATFYHGIPERNFRCKGKTFDRSIHLC